MASGNPILVTGTGRSGTTLCMYLLKALGATMSPNLKPASPQNPYGGMEDEEIFRLHQNLYSALHINSSLPLPPHWVTLEPAQKTKNLLKNLLWERMNFKPNHPWAVKDPNLSLFLPLWIQLFNGIKAVPIIILCVRHPNSVCKSMEIQYGRGPEESLMTWMLRNAYTLIHSGGNCVVIHYEEWELNGITQFERFTKETLLENNLRDQTPENILNEIFKVRLNRTRLIKKDPILNPAVNRLYEALLAIPGGTIAGRKPLIAADECLREIDQFQGMAVVAQNALKLKDELKKKHQAQAAFRASTQSELTSSQQELEKTKAALAVAQDTILDLQNQNLIKSQKIDRLRIQYEQLRKDLEKQNSLNNIQMKHLRFLEFKLVEQREMFHSMNLKTPEHASGH